MDIKPTKEQELIISDLKNTKVNSVAGSGKSTTILLLSKKYNDLKMMQITYNSMLKCEMREKVKKYDIKNLEIHTYHSIVTKYYDNTSFDDEQLKKVIKQNMPIKTKLKVDVLMIDEAQDMTNDYYKLIKKFIKDNEIKPYIYLFGDTQQTIYEFKNASSQFLTLANDLWNIRFDEKELTESFRLSNQIGFFVNNCMLEKPRIQTNKKTNFKVDYYITNPFRIYLKIGKEIIKLKKEGYKDEDFFILVPSVKTINAPYKKLENYLVKNNINCMTPDSDDVKLDEKLIQNKVVFTTYHQSKGRERKIVIVYNFDISYYTFYSKELLNKNNCPNIFYVVCTRAKEKLILVRDEKCYELPFLKFNHPNIDNNLNIIITNKKIKPNDIKTDESFIKKSVTDFVKFLSSTATNELIELVNELYEEIENKNKLNVKIKSQIEVKKEVFEDVSNLNGLVISAIFEKKSYNNENNISTIEFYVQTHILNNRDIKKYAGKINIPCKTIEDYLKVGNVYTSIQNQLHSKIMSIKDYDWLDEKIVDECLKNMEFIKSKNLLFEYPITNNDDINEQFYTYNHSKYGLIKITSRIDAFDDENIYEFKCVNKISLDHKLQLIFYYWLWINSDLKLNYGNKTGILLNIRTGTIYKLKKNIQLINQVIETIITDKFTNNKNMDDDEFLKTIKI